MRSMGGRYRCLPGSLVISLIGWWCLGVGCVPSKVQVQAAPQFDPSRISSLAILPFQTIKTPQLASSSTRGGIRDPEEIRTQFRLPGTDQADGTESRKVRYVVPETAAHRITITGGFCVGRPAFLTGDWSGGVFCRVRQGKLRKGNRHCPSWPKRSEPA